MNIAIASGKGGTGKTTVSVNLAALLSPDYDVTLVDCDVEEPNVHLFLSPEWPQEHTCRQPVPTIDTTSCLGSSCKVCTTACHFRALVWMGEVITFPELCHGCGLCFEVCDAQAITEAARTIGMVRCGTLYPAQRKKAERYQSDNGLHVVSGCMRIGEAMSPPLIRETLATASAPSATSCTIPCTTEQPVFPSPTERIIIRDCPPGTSCPMITAVDGADIVLLVTEPTPFGLHDLTIAVKTLRTLQLPFGVVLSRHGIGDERVERYCSDQRIPLLARLPHSTEAALVCSNGQLLIDHIPQQRKAFQMLWEQINTQLTPRHFSHLSQLPQQAAVSGEAS